MTIAPSIDRAVSLVLQRDGACLREVVARRQGRRRNPARTTPRSPLRTTTTPLRHSPHRWVEKCGRSIKGSETPQRPLRDRERSRHIRPQRRPDRVPRQPRAPDQLLDRNAPHEMLPPQLRPALHVQHAFLPASINTTEPGSRSPRTPPPTVPRGVKSQPAKGGQFLTGADSAGCHRPHTNHPCESGPTGPSRGERQACWGWNVTAWPSRRRRKPAEVDGGESVLIERSREGMIFLGCLQRSSVPVMDVAINPGVVK
jgi:hypothetical protein